MEQSLTGRQPPSVLPGLMPVRTRRGSRLGRISQKLLCRPGRRGSDVLFGPTELATNMPLVPTVRSGEYLSVQPTFAPHRVSALGEVLLVDQRHQAPGGRSG